MGEFFKIDWLFEGIVNWIFLLVNFMWFGALMFVSWQLDKKYKTPAP